LDTYDRKLYAAQAALCRVFTHPARIRILHMLGERERSVLSLADDLRISQPALSRHLALLRDRGVVRTRREGTTIYYQLADLKLLEACRLMREVLQRRQTDPKPARKLAVPRPQRPSAGASSDGRDRRNRRERRSN
jgi:ArsR family transcriptional regulator, virulence genes transcriptional regulator